MASELTTILSASGNKTAPVSASKESFIKVIISLTNCVVEFTLEPGSQPKSMTKLAIDFYNSEGPLALDFS